MNVYDFSAKSIKGKVIPLSQFKGKVLLIVNTATHCGYTKQYNAMQTIYQQYQPQGLEILDFPSHTFLQTPEDNAGIEAFCERQFKTTFTTFEKIEVNGNTAHPLYQYLRKQNPQKTDMKIEWNFTKFLVNRRGEVVSRYNAKTTPEMLVKEIEKLLNDR